MHGATRVLLLHTHTLQRQGLVELLRPRTDIEVVLATARSEEALAAVRRLRPHVVLTEEPAAVSMDLCRAFTRLHPRLPIALLGSTGDLAVIQRAFRQGATAYVPREAGVDDLVACLETLRREGRRAGPLLAVPRAAPAVPPPAISQRERQVLSLVAAGHANRQIGRALSISENTVRNHLANIFGKLGVTDRTEAAVQALRRGLL